MYIKSFPGHGDRTPELMPVPGLGVRYDNLPTKFRLKKKKRKEKAMVTSLRARPQLTSNLTT
jgi:hypothetical protein